MDVICSFSNVKIRLFFKTSILIDIYENNKKRICKTVRINKKTPPTMAGVFFIVFYFI